MAKNYNEGVAKAIEVAGGTYDALAVKLKCSTTAIRKMLYNNCTAERAVEIEKVLKGKVKREEIRPDIFADYKPSKQTNSVRLSMPKHLLDEVEKPTPEEPLKSDDVVRDQTELVIDSTIEEPAELPEVTIARPGRRAS